MDTEYSESNETMDATVDILLLNKDAMDWMKLGAYQSCLDMLKKAEDALQKS